MRMGTTGVLGKHVIVDTQSLLHSRVAIGVGHINWHGLREVCRKDVGGCPTLHQMFCTIHPRQAECSRIQGLRHDLRQAGITLMEVASSREQDDLVISDRILVSARAKNEIVLVSCDTALIEDLIWAGKEYAVPVHLVATKYPDEMTQTSRLGRDILELIKRGLLSFFELADYKPRIGMTMSVHAH